MAKKVFGKKGFASAWMAVGLAIAALAHNGASGVGRSLANPTPYTLNPTPHTLITVNSNKDGPVEADSELTLREAIEIANGTLPLEELSEAEKANISLTENPGETTIAFDLDPERTEIKLVELLPAIAKPGLTIDGATQPGYDPERWGSGDTIPIPVVSITTAMRSVEKADRGSANPVTPNRGLTVMADRVTIRGLMLYGFRDSPAQMLRQSGSSTNILTNTPAADILIVGEDWLEIGENGEPAPTPKEIVIENNWLGIGPFEERQGGQGRLGDKGAGEQGAGEQGSRGAGETFPYTLHPTPYTLANSLHPTPYTLHPSPIPYTLHPTPYTLPRSGFGVFVHNGNNVTVRQNQIAYHDGSGIITGVRAENLQIEENIIFANGLAGMPDAIRLEGNIANSRVTGNIISENDGAGIFLFKPSGSVLIEDNEITDNGRRLRRAAVYLMGSGHQVRNNQIVGQPGPGVVVAADGKNRRNSIVGNRFGQLEGLSIDLNTRLNQDASHYQVGDGPNPPRDTDNRRKGTGNGAINAPVFLARDFYIMEDGKVRIDGIADPGSTVEIYRVSSDCKGEAFGIISRSRDNPKCFAPTHGPLTEPIATVETDAQGSFGISSEVFGENDRVSAIGTHPDYGTSEPARNAEIRELEF